MVFIHLISPYLVDIDFRIKTLFGINQVYLFNLDHLTGFTVIATVNVKLNGKYQVTYLKSGYFEYL